jgi:hypothetical protein
MSSSARSVIPTQKNEKTTHSTIVDLVGSDDDNDGDQMTKRQDAFIAEVSRHRDASAALLEKLKSEKPVSFASTSDDDDDDAGAVSGLDSLSAAITAAMEKDADDVTTGDDAVDTAAASSANADPAAASDPRPVKHNFAVAFCKNPKEDAKSYLCSDCGKDARTGLGPCFFACRNTKDIACLACTEFQLLDVDLTDSELEESRNYIIRQQGIAIRRLTDFQALVGHVVPSNDPKFMIAIRVKSVRGRGKTAKEPKRYIGPLYSATNLKTPLTRKQLEQRTEEIGCENLIFESSQELGAFYANVSSNRVMRAIDTGFCFRKRKEFAGLLYLAVLQSQQYLDESSSETEIVQRDQELALIRNCLRHFSGYAAYSHRKVESAAAMSDDDDGEDDDDDDDSPENFVAFNVLVGIFHTAGADQGISTDLAVLIKEYLEEIPEEESLDSDAEDLVDLNPAESSTSANDTKSLADLLEQNGGPFKKLKATMAELNEDFPETNDIDAVDADIIAEDGTEAFFRTATKEGRERYAAECRADANLPSDRERARIKRDAAAAELKQETSAPPSKRRRITPQTDSVAAPQPAPAAAAPPAPVVNGDEDDSFAVNE